MNWSKLETRCRAVSVPHTKTLGVFNSLDRIEKCRKTSPVKLNSIVPLFVLCMDTCMGNLSALSFDHIRKAKPMDLSCETQLIRLDLARDLVMAGSKTPSSNTTVTIQINKSHPVNPPVLCLAWFGFMRLFGCAFPLAALMPLRFSRKCCVFDPVFERFSRGPDELHALPSCPPWLSREAAKSAKFQIPLRKLRLFARPSGDPRTAVSD